ncbi:MAG: hypothetical protein P3W91_001030 [Fervidobacterium sp.]|nr:hypothetical protein [Fervidobacterium sp.]
MKWIIVWFLIVGVLGLCFTQSEVSMLRYQLQMPTVSGNAMGFRLVGTLKEGGVGMVWKVENKIGLFTGQILAYNSVLYNWLETGVFDWAKVYFDVFLLLRF